MHWFHEFVKTGWKLAVISVLVVSSGCSGFTETAPAANNSAVKVNMVLPEGVSLKPDGSILTDDPILGAATITGITLTVSAADISTVVENIPLDTLEATVSVQAGNSRTFTITVTTDTLETFTGSETINISSGQSVELTITVDLTGATTGDTTAPGAPSITSPSSGTSTNSSTPTISGTAEANSTVEVFTGGTTSGGSTTADGSGNWSLTTATLSDGTYSFTAKATDSAGNVSSASSAVSLTIDTAAPTVTFNSPSSGAKDIAVTSTISVTFSEAVDTSTVTTSTFTLDSGGSISGSISFSGSNTIATFTPASSLSENTTYTVTLASGITDVIGNAFAGTSWSFTTELAAPTGVKAGAGNAKNIIIWSSVAGATSYNIYWSTSSGVTTSSSKITGVTSPYDHKGLTNGTLYYYKVVASNSGGEGTLSSEVSLSPAVVGAVLGQSDSTGVALSNAIYDEGGSSDTSPYGLQSPQYMAVDSTNHRLFVGDELNNRVLVFNLNTDNTISSRKAAFVLGQADFEHSDADRGTTAAANSLDGVKGVEYYDDGTDKWLLVVDNNNSRVLIYKITNGVTNGMSASYVLGQADFTTTGTNRTGSTTTAAANTLYWPDGVMVTAVGTQTLLMVADKKNNRVLVWNITTGGISSLFNGTSGTENAGFALGQASLTARLNQTGTTGLNDPSGLAISGNYLIVSEKINDRIIIYDLGVNAGNLASGLAASYLLGQSVWTGAASGTAQNKLAKPMGIAVNGTYIFAADRNNHRIMIWNISGGITGLYNGQTGTQNASNIFGNTVYTSANTNTSQNELLSPVGLELAGNILYVSEEGSDRVVTFNISTVTDNQNATDLIGQTDWRPGMTDGAESVVWTADGNDDTGAVGLGSPNDLTTGTIGGTNYLFVADHTNVRVLVFTLNEFFMPLDMQADFVLGQDDFDHESEGLSTTRTMGAKGIAFDNTSGYLFVADSDSSVTTAITNNRILVYDLSGGITTGMAASFVLGQSNATTGTVNAGAGSGSPTATTLYDSRKMDVGTLSGTRYLFVADKLNKRVVIYNLSDGVTTGESAVYFLGNGASDVGNNYSTTTGQAVMGSVYGIDFDETNKRLFASESSASRVMVWNLSGGITSGANAANVIGQSTFTATASGITSSTLSKPEDINYDERTNVLWISDSTNNRVLKFDMSGGITDGMAATGVFGQSNYTTNTAYIGSSRTSTTTDYPSGLWIEPKYGYVFVASEGDDRILILNPE